MRIVVYFVISLIIINNAVVNTSSKEITGYDCEDLVSQVRTLKQSSKTKKDKFSCILSLLKSVLTEELENPQCDAAEIEDLNACKSVPEEKVPDESVNISEIEKEAETDTNNTIDVLTDINIDHVDIQNESKDNKIPKDSENCPQCTEKTPFEKLVAKVTQLKSKYCTNNTKNSEVPNMIAIFKPRPVYNNDIGDSSPGLPMAGNYNPSREVGNLRQASEYVQGNLNPINNAPKFTIPCQRAADVLDMAMATPRESEKRKQLRLNSKPPVPISSTANQTPSKVSVHCADLDDSVYVLFKPKAISLLQLYGNLLKKITMTVLVPYHVSKYEQQ